MKHLVGKTQTKKVDFCGDTVEIKKLSIAAVNTLQGAIKKASKKDDGIEVIRVVLRAAVVGAEELTDEELNTFAPSDLNELAEAILEFCGLATDSKAGN